jgi:two-component system, LuxR family, sensor kinase FixL
MDMIEEHEQPGADGQERLRILFAQAPDAYYLHDLMGTFLDANQAAEKLLGYQREELIGKSLLKSDLLSPKQLPRAAGYLAQNATGRPVGPVELRLNRKDGTSVPVEICTRPVHMGGQHVVLGIARDVSKRRKAEDLLHESADKFKIIFEEACEGIVYLDDAGRVLEVNRRTLEILGQAREQIIGKHFIELGVLDPGDVARFLNHFQQMLLGTLQPLDLRLTNQQGRKLYLECSASLVHRKGGARGLVVMIRDVTERQQTEQMLEVLNQNLKSTVENLERSNQELRDFAHVAAHDLKAPLRGIATLADWIAQDSADKIGEQGQTNLSLLRQRVGRMTRLIDGILRYAEIGHDELSVEPVDANAVATEVIEQVAPPEHVVIRLESPLPVVPCERTRLTQVFQNLISNAVKYMDKPEGQITVGYADEADFWRFHVTDNGPGIASKYFDRIFRMFQTLAPKDEHESTGIGLALVKKIVEWHGGRVWLESEVGRGSTFFFTLPKSEKVDASRQQKRSPAPAMREETSVQESLCPNGLRE